MYSYNLFYQPLVSLYFSKSHHVSRIAHAGSIYQEVLFSILGIYGREIYTRTSLKNVVAITAGHRRAGRSPSHCTHTAQSAPRCADSGTTTQRCALHLPSSLCLPQRTAVLGRAFAMAPMGSCYAASSASNASQSYAVSPISRSDVGGEHRDQRVLQLGALVAVRDIHMHPNGQTVGRHDQHQGRPVTILAAPHVAAPVLAATKLPSMKASAKSS